MMCSSSEEEDEFYDTREELSSASDLSFESVDNNLEFIKLGGVDFALRSLEYELWIKDPGSIHERRNKFLKWMGLSVDRSKSEEFGTRSYDEVEVEMEMDRIRQGSGAVLGSSGLEIDDRVSLRQSSMSCWPNDARESLDEAVEDGFFCRFKNLDDGTEFVVDELGKDGMLSRLREVGSNRLVTLDEFERSLGLSPLFQQVIRSEVEDTCRSRVETKQFKKGWLKRLAAMTCIVDGQVEEGSLKVNDFSSIARKGNQMVRVRPHRKRSKDWSAVYMGQDILAHEGSILTMKFSPDGQYLASAGEDGIVRVWKVMESDRSYEFDSLGVDPSHVCFTMNHLSELVPLNVDKERKGKLKSLRKLSDTTCVIFPRKVFQISERPLHEFHGHSAEVLDLSWSKNKHLLSSSVDKTVRLWQVGRDLCLRVFYHNNYVTCAQFNPMDDGYFISGSIDGKVRIWAIHGCQVVDWTDIKEIVTAVCYSPDGMGANVGSMTGDCQFYDASDNRLQLYAQICLQGKKKSPFKRITGFQFSPSDPSKLMVTSADSQVRILHGLDVICKYRGLRNAGTQISASFTSDGKHIVSASEDSNVYVWNYISHDGPVPAQPKNHWACERFISNNASVAIPWCGITCGDSIDSNATGAFPSPKLSVDLPRCGQENGLQQCHLGESSLNKLPFSSPDHFSFSHGFFSDSLLPKGTATWPEEKLPTSSSLVVPSAMCKSQLKFLKTSCQSMINSSHAWGKVIVTAGWDGRIRVFQNYGLPIG